MTLVVAMPWTGAVPTDTVLLGGLVLLAVAGTVPLAGTVL
jgi:hypothetical protein